MNRTFEFTPTALVTYVHVQFWFWHLQTQHGIGTDEHHKIVKAVPQFESVRAASFNLAGESIINVTYHLGGILPGLQKVFVVWAIGQPAVKARGGVMNHAASQKSANHIGILFVQQHV